MKKTALLNKSYHQYSKNRFRFYLLFLWLVLVGVFAYQIRNLKVSFEFENFFPKDNEEIAFYQQHLTYFDYDNDYLLLVLKNKPSIFHTDFLSRASELEQQISGLSNTLECQSLFSLKHILKSPTGLMGIPLIHPDENAQLPHDSARVMRHPLYSQLVSNDGQGLLLHITHPHFTDAQESKAYLEQLEEIVAASTIPYHIAGKLSAQNTFVSLIQQDFVLFLSLALILSFLLLWIIFRSFRAALMPYLISLSTLIMLLGIMALANQPITILGSLIPPVILFVSTSDAVHLMKAYKEQSVGNAITKLIAAIKKVFKPTLLTSITTAVGFASLITIKTGPIQSFGVFTGIGVLIAFVITFLFGPLLVKPYAKKQSALISAKRLTLFVFRNARLTGIISFIVCALSVWGLFQLKTDAYLLKDLPEDSSVRKDFEYVDQQLGGSKPWEMAFWPTDSATNSIWSYPLLQELHKIHQYLDTAYEMDRVLSPVSFANYAYQIQNGGAGKFYQFPDSLSYAKSKGIIYQFNQMGAFSTFEGNARYGRITGFIPELGSYETQKRNAALLAFMEKHIDASVLSYHITGTTYLIDKSHEILSYHLWKGLLIAMAIIGLLMGLYFKSFKIFLISLIPNIIPLLITAGYMGSTDIPLKLTTSIIFAVAFGIAVDDTIHFISAYQQVKSKTFIWRIVKTFQTAGSAIIITTCIMLVGFGLFLLSGFGATYFLGLFLSLSLLFALLTDILLLPILLASGKNTS